MRYRWINWIISSSLVASFPVLSWAQEAPAKFERRAYSRSSGTFAGASGPGARSESLFQDTVRVPEASWLRIHFGNYHLGPESYITLKSIEDQGEQKLTAETMEEWGHSSAIFNGSAVDVDLTVAPGEQGVFFNIDEVSVGLQSDLDVPESLCGPDDRVASTDVRVGRIMPGGCTGWIISNGAFLTAGHCVGPDMQILEFGVPVSRPDGTPVAAAPEDQYPIDLNSIDFSYTAKGDDWAVFSVFPNQTTGDLPARVQGGFYRMTSNGTPAAIEITGHGIDTKPAGPPPRFRNPQSQTQQTSTGGFTLEDIQAPSRVIIRYTVDTTGGNSGSPIVSTVNGVTVGIHTNGGCSQNGGSNLGTGFKNNDLEQAIQIASGDNIVYVDSGHPEPNEDGTVFRPFDSISEGVANAAPDGTVSIVAGAYAEAVTLDRRITLEAPVGTVTIGADP